MDDQTLEQVKIEAPTEQPMEQIPAPEQPVESAPVKPVETVPQPAPPVESVQPATVELAPAVPAGKSEMQKQIEDTLALGLESVYVALPPEKQKLFQQSGERTASEVEALLAQPKPDIHKLHDVISAWLSSIDGLNKYFLEQDLKIKMDLLLKMKE